MSKKIITYLILVLFFAGCRKENDLDCLKSTGSDETDIRNTGPFTIIKLYSKIDLNISQGAEFKIEVVAGKHIINNIKTTLTDGVLSIDNYNKCNFVRGYKRNITVNITLPYIVRVENRGVGTIRFNESFAQDTMQLLAENSGDIYLNGTYNEIRSSSHGDGDIYLSGSCNRLFGYLYGTNIIDSRNLTIGSYVFIESISIADCHIHAPEGGTFECNIWRKGNIYYSGNPATINRFKGDGDGQVIKE